MTPPPLVVALVDAFTATPGQGNRAAVVADADGLDDATLQRIAAAMNVSETAFVTSDAECDFRLRWFTPVREVDFCGHGTVATLHRLAELGRIAMPAESRFNCRVGPIAFAMERDDDGALRVWSEAPVPTFADPPLPAERLCGLLDVEPEYLDPEVPVRAAFGISFVPLASRSEVAALSPHFGAIAAALEDGVHGICAFARDPHEPGNFAFSRFFTPAYGIREDPVTGSTNAPLVALCAEAGVLPLPEGGGTVSVRNEQGDDMGQAGRVDVELSVDASGKAERIRFGSRAVTVLVGALSATA